MERRMVRGTTPGLSPTARRLRADATAAEALLWEAIRGRRLSGVKFRRQHAIGRFVLDFYCAAAHLVIELDGGVHENRREQDEDRARVLEAAGYRVLRFSNEAVLSDLPAVLARIQQAACVPPLPIPGEGARG